MAEQPTDNQSNKKPLTEDDIKEEPASSGNNTALKVILIVLGVIVILSIAAFAAIGWAGRTFFDRVSDSIEVNEDSIRIGGEENGVEISGGEELPDDFPAAIPIYEPSELQSSSRFRQNEEVVWSANFSSDSATDVVGSHYESVLTENGWEVTNVFESDEMLNISAINQAADLNIQLMVTSGTETQSEFNMTVIRSSDE